MSLLSCRSASPETSPDEQIKDTIGSGPFKFVKDEWQPGHQAVFVKNPEYVPRKEPASWAAGGKVVRVDRVVWLYIPDSATAMAAFTAGEADWWENPPPDFYPLLAKDEKVTLVQSSPLSVAGILRFNQLQPPFDNAKIRQAFLYASISRNICRQLAGDPKYWRACYSFYACGGPMATEAGAELLKGPRDLAKARQLIKEAGYQGREDRSARSDRFSRVAFAGAGDRRPTAPPRRQCRGASGGLGHARVPSFVKGSRSNTAGGAFF